MSLATQKIFADAVLDAERPTPPVIASHRQSTKRFAVYRNNVTAGLVNALRTRFPVVEKIVGEEFFVAMARIFAVEHPPRSPLMMRYGDGFAEFIAAFPPAAELPYLADVARLEAARTSAFHAADAEPIAPSALQGILPAELSGLRVKLQPSLQIIRSRHPIVTIWAMNSGEAELGPIDEDTPEDALVVRLHLEVTVRKLPPGGAAFLLAFADGLPLALAAERAAMDDASFDLSVNVAGLLQSGAMVGFTLADAVREQER